MNANPLTKLYFQEFWTTLSGISIDASFTKRLLIEMLKYNKYEIPYSKVGLFLEVGVKCGSLTHSGGHGHHSFYTKIQNIPYDQVKDWQKYTKKYYQAKKIPIPPPEQPQPIEEVQPIVTPFTFEQQQIPQQDADSKEELVLSEEMLCISREIFFQMKQKLISNKELIEQMSNELKGLKKEVQALKGLHKLLEGEKEALRKNVSIQAYEIEELTRGLKNKLVVKYPIADISFLQDLSK
jgi:hypothetical protein